MCFIAQGRRGYRCCNLKTFGTFSSSFSPSPLPPPSPGMWPTLMMSLHFPQFSAPLQGQGENRERGRDGEIGLTKSMSPLRQRRRGSADSNKSVVPRRSLSPRNFRRPQALLSPTTNTQRRKSSMTLRLTRSKYLECVHCPNPASSGQGLTLMLTADPFKAARWGWKVGGRRGQNSVGYSTSPATRWRNKKSIFFVFLSFPDLSCNTSTLRCNSLMPPKCF